MKVGWGILGCGRIARGAVGPAIVHSSNGRLVAVGSRSVESAAEAGTALGATRFHGSYEALVEDPDVQAVYIGLPNGLHETWAIRAARAGKHVLCEKALALGVDSARRMAAAFEAKGLRLLEAFMYRHHPQWNVVRRLLAEGSLGELRALRACLTGKLDRADDHRWSASLGGGALFDVTCYGIDVARWLVGREPKRVAAVADTSTPEGVDASTQASLDFGDGVLGSVAGSLVAERDQTLVLIGSEGVLEVPRPFIPGWDPTEVVLRRGADTQRLPIGGANHFLHQVEHFASLVLDPTRPSAPAENGLSNAIACEAVARSFRSGSVVEVAPPLVRAAVHGTGSK